MNESGTWKHHGSWNHRHSGDGPKISVCPIISALESQWSSRTISIITNFHYKQKRSNTTLMADGATITNQPTDRQLCNHSNPSMQAITRAAQNRNIICRCWLMQRRQIRGYYNKLYKKASGYDWRPDDLEEIRKQYCTYCTHKTSLCSQHEHNFPSTVHWKYIINTE